MISGEQQFETSKKLPNVDEVGVRPSDQFQSIYFPGILDEGPRLYRDIVGPKDWLASEN